jgi:DNA primase
MEKMDAVEEVKSRLSIEDVISEYVQLKRAGRNWKGLSPFSSERTPSFVVSPEKQIWHDFSSGKGGNMFSFVMELEGLDFRGALELLARKANVDLTQYQSGYSGGPNKERLYAALELATKFYQVQFSKNPRVLRYVLQERQFSKETALEWQLGYSPNTGTALVDFLRSKKFTSDEIAQAGLSSSRYRGVSDMFRGRLMIPLCDQQGRVIGFTARQLDKNPDAPKYINTPQTVLYDKSRHVFGLHLAKEAIRHEHFVVIAEGNLDVIQSYQANVRQVVATAGTALTEPHLKTLSRLTTDIRLSFDADKAGVNATERAIPIASKVGVSLGIIVIPSGKDPDELIKQDPELWRQTITERHYALDWLMERYNTLLDVTTAEGKRRYSDVLLPIVRQLDDSVEQDHYLQAIAGVIGVSQAALVSKFEDRTTNTLSKPRKSLPPQPVLDAQVIERQKAEDHFIALLYMQPELRHYLKELPDNLFTTPAAQELVAYMRVHLSKQPDDHDPALQKVADYVKIISLEYEELYHGLEFTELHYEAARLYGRLIETFVKQQKQQLTAQMNTVSDTEMTVLLTRVRQLDALLGQIRKGELHGE